MSSNSSSWVARQAKDPYVQKARKEGWRSRASFKLLEIQKKYKLFRPGMNVLDLGSAPGGWSQVLKSIMQDKGNIWALDLLEMDPIPGVKFIQGDFTQDEAYKKLSRMLVGQKLDWVISDMAPNMSGIRLSDQAKSMALVELGFDFAQQFLKPGGGYIAKVFHGVGLQNFTQSLRQSFTQVVYRKPESSRPKSREVYLIAKGWRG
jgi:23S rRNA (uridine2552-2'-O)-methyltransferase